MNLTRRVANLAGIALPLFGLGVAIALLWDRMVGFRELTILCVGYVVAGLGITVGYHRLFTHRSFQTFPAIRYAFAVCGQFAVQGNVVSWVANHRKHHQFSDQDGDPHSPHAGRGDGFVEGFKGLWHAHTGWLFDGDAVADRNRYAPDLIDDRGLRVVALVLCEPPGGRRGEPTRVIRLDVRRLRHREQPPQPASALGEVAAD